MLTSGCFRRFAGLMFAIAGSHPSGHRHQGVGSDREQQQCRQGEPGETLLIFADLLEHGAILPRFRDGHGACDHTFRSGVQADVLMRVAKYRFGIAQATARILSGLNSGPAL